MITLNCNKARCQINGQLNTGECKCVLASKGLTPEQVIAHIEDKTISIDTVEDATELLQKIVHLSYNDRVNRLIIGFQRYANEVANGQT